MDEAIEWLSNAIRLKAGYVEAMVNLGLALRLKGRLEEAIALLRRALQIAPGNSEGWSQLGSALVAEGNVKEGIEAHRRAVRLSPGRAEFHCGLGIALRSTGLLDEAIESLERAASLDPGMIAAANNLGVALRDAGRVKESIHVLSELVARKPGFEEGHWNLALSLLLDGDFANGWREYEWRRDKSGRHWSQVYPVPAWDGSALNGRRLLVHCEQGFGDVIQSARFLWELMKKDGEIVFAVPPELERLMKSSIDFARVVRAGDPAEGIHVHCSVQSLPFLLGCGIEREGAYLRVEEGIRGNWHEKIGELDGNIDVGLAWLGNPRPDPGRSVPGELLKPLIEMEGIRFHSVQKDSMEPGVTDHSHELVDFAETAGLISNLDLVISIDTSVAHLAGALGKAVWVMLPFSADWRWLLGREDSPWYPTARLYRQERVGDWGSVVERVSRELNLFRSRRFAS